MLREGVLCIILHVWGHCPIVALCVDGVRPDEVVEDKCVQGVILVERPRDLADAGRQVARRVLGHHPRDAPVRAEDLAVNRGCAGKAV